MCFLCFKMPMYFSSRQNKWLPGPKRPASKKVVLRRRSLMTVISRLGSLCISDVFHFLFAVHVLSYTVNAVSHSTVSEVLTWCPQLGTVYTETMVSSAGNPKLSKVLSFKPSVSENVAFHASSAARFPSSPTPPPSSSLWSD